MRWTLCTCVLCTGAAAEGGARTAAPSSTANSREREDCQESVHAASRGAVFRDSEASSRGQFEWWK